MSRFSDYLSSQITPQMTLLEKFNLMIKFLKENNYISVFYSQEKYNVQKESYQKEKVNLNGFTLHIGDCIVFSNGYYAFVEMLGENTFTIGNVLYFQGEQGVSVVGATISSGNLILTLSDGENVNAGFIGAVSSFSINDSQHLIVHYANGTTQDLGAIFSGDINVSGDLTATGTIDGNLITGNEIKEKMSGYSFVAPTASNVEITHIYDSVVKNGNKITLVAFIKLNRTSEYTSNYLDICRFNIPQAVANKLYPTNIGGVNVLDIKKIIACTSISSTVDLTEYIQKSTGLSQLIFGIYGVSDLVPGTDYYIRCEVTFLLSDNLAE